MASESTDTQERKRTLSVGSIVRGAITIAIVAGIFLGVMPAIADYDDVWATITEMTFLETASLVLVALWNLVTYWFVMTAVLPGLTFRQAAVVNQASTAVSNTLPAGGALGVGVSYAMYNSWGFSGSAFALATVVSGLWNTFVKLGLPIVALALVAITGGANPGLITASMLGLAVLLGAIVVFGLMLRSEGFARRVGNISERVANRVRGWLRRSPISDWGNKAAAFFAKTSGLVHDRWLRITVSALVSHISLYVVLLMALRHVGISESDVGWVQVLAAFAFVRLISALPITPGGVGVVELGYAAALGAGLDDPEKAQVVAAVLLFRFITYVIPIPLGAGAYLFWRRNKSWRVSAAPAAPGPEGT